MKTKYYEISGVTEKNIHDWSSLIDSDVKIFSILHKGIRTIKIIMEMNIFEYISARIQLFMFNKKHNTNLTIKSLE